MPNSRRRASTMAPRLTTGRSGRPAPPPPPARRSRRRCGRRCAATRRGSRRASAIVELRAAGKRAQRFRRRAPRRARREPHRAVVHRAVAGQRDVVGAVDHDRALLPRVVAPDACDDERRGSAQRSVTRGARPAQTHRDRPPPRSPTRRRIAGRGACSARRRRECRARRGSRASSTTRGRAGSSSSSAARRNATRATCGIARTRSSNPARGRRCRPRAWCARRGRPAARAPATRRAIGGTTPP